MAGYLDQIIESFILNPAKQVGGYPAQSPMPTQPIQVTPMQAQMQSPQVNISTAPQQPTMPIQGMQMLDPSKFGAAAGQLQGAQAAYANTQNQRLPGIAGGLEGLWDAFREPTKRKELVAATDKAMALQAQKEQADLLKKEMERIQRGDAIFQAATQANLPPDVAKQYAILGSQDEKIAQKIMEQIGTKMVGEGPTDETRSREERVQWAGTEQGKQILGPMSESERYYFLSTGELPTKNITTSFDLPKDYRWVGKPGQQMEVIPGSKTEHEMTQEKIAAQRNWRQTTLGAARVVDMAKDALSKVGISTVGPIGQVLSQIPGTPAADMQRILDSLKANTGFDRLQQMRQASVTGGALGNVSNREIELLYNSMAPLGGEGAVQMSPGQMEESLKTIIASYERLATYAKNPKFFDQMTDEEYFQYWADRGLAPEMAALSTPNDRPNPEDDKASFQYYLDNRNK